MPDAAARSYEVGALEVFGRDHHARPEREDAHGAVRLLEDDAADGEVALADPHAIAHGKPELLEQGRMDEGAALAHERGHGPGRLRLELAVQRVTRRDRLQLDDLAASGARRHGDQLAMAQRVHAVTRELVHDGFRAGGERLAAPDLDVAAHERARRAPHRALEARREASHGHQRGHAQGDARDEIRELPRRSPRLAPRQPQREHLMEPSPLWGESRVRGCSIRR